MREVLESLLHSEHSWASQRAAMALEIIALHEAGGIADDELGELMMDLCRADKLDAEATDLEVKAMLVTAVYAAGKLI